MSKYPNIRHKRTEADTEHRRECIRPCDGEQGDVRRCMHDKPQYAMPGAKKPGNGGVSSYWYDLSPVFDFVLYRRAIQALAQADSERRDDFDYTDEDLKERPR